MYRDNRSQPRYTCTAANRPPHLHAPLHVPTYRLSIVQSFRHSIISFLFLSAILFIVPYDSATLRFWGPFPIRYTSNAGAEREGGFARPPAPDDLPYFPMRFCCPFVAFCPFFGRLTASLLALSTFPSCAISSPLHASPVVVPFSHTLTQLDSNYSIIFRPQGPKQNKIEFRLSPE